MKSRTPAHTDSEEDDRYLALLWKRGDRKAYEALVQRHLDGIHCYITSRIGHHSDVDDVCQEVFLDVCLKIKNYDPAYAFGAWLFTIARRKVADRFRRLKPSEEFIPEIHDGSVTEHPSSTLEEKDSASHAWQQVFYLLPENQATALWLKVQGEMPLQAIADIMGQSLGNVKVLLFRARKSLAEIWKTPTQLEL